MATIRFEEDKAMEFLESLIVYNSVAKELPEVYNKALEQLKKESDGENDVIEAYALLLQTLQTCGETESENLAALIGQETSGFKIKFIQHPIIEVTPNTEKQ